MLKFTILFLSLLLVTTHSEARGRRPRKKTTPDPLKEIASWHGPWFPHKPIPESVKKDIASWKYQWFPHKPYEKEEDPDNIEINTCDDGEHSIGIDFDPHDVRQSYNYLCIGNRSAFAPQLNTEAHQIEYFIPPAYVPPVKCLNESIHYIESLPTFGPFRPYAPKYGTYQYLPPQRYLYALAQGAIVMVYHPCAFAGQVELLQKTVRGCLYRHIITPSQALTPERPIALLAWGKSLEMSVMDQFTVIDFIKRNAKQGPIANWDLAKETKTYSAGLIAEAHLVTDVNDQEVCGYAREM